MKRKFHRIPMVLIAVMLALVLIASSAVAVFTDDVETSTDNTFVAGTLDLAVNDENPWEPGAFTFIGISPGGDPMAFDFKLRNVGGAPGVLSFSIEVVSENDIANAPAPDMSADEFASLIYVEAVHYLYRCPADEYEGTLQDDLDSWILMDANADNKVSLYEIDQAGIIAYDLAGDPFVATAEITYFIEFQLGDSLDGGVAGGAILLDVVDNDPQGDGVSVTVSATLAPYTPD